MQSGPITARSSTGISATVSLPAFHAVSKPQGTCRLQQIVASISRIMWRVGGRSKLFSSALVDFFPFARNGPRLAEMPIAKAAVLA